MAGRTWRFASHRRCAGSSVGYRQAGVVHLYSGPLDVFESQKELLEVLTSTDYRGEDPGLAALYYQIGMDMFWTGMLSYLHAVAVGKANGITAEQLKSHAISTMASRRNSLSSIRRASMQENIRGRGSARHGRASVEHIVHTTHDAGIDASLPKPCWRSLNGVGQWPWRGQLYQPD